MVGIFQRRRGAFGAAGRSLTNDVLERMQGFMSLQQGHSTASLTDCLKVLPTGIRRCCTSMTSIQVHTVSTQTQGNDNSQDASTLKVVDASDDHK